MLILELSSTDRRISFIFYITPHTSKDRGERGHAGASKATRAECFPAAHPPSLAKNKPAAKSNLVSSSLFDGAVIGRVFF